MKSLSCRNTGSCILHSNAKTCYVLLSSSHSDTEISLIHAQVDFSVLCRYIKSRYFSLSLSLSSSSLTNKKATNKGHHIKYEHCQLRMWFCLQLCDYKFTFFSINEYQIFRGQFISIPEVLFVLILIS